MITQIQSLLRLFTDNRSEMGSTFSPLLSFGFAGLKTTHLAGKGSFPECFCGRAGFSFVFAAKLDRIAKVGVIGNCRFFCCPCGNLSGRRSSVLTAICSTESHESKTHPWKSQAAPAADRPFGPPVFAPAHGCGSCFMWTALCPDQAQRFSISGHNHGTSGWYKI